MPRIDRPTFFKAARQTPFGGHLSQGQVDGMNRIIDAWEARYVQRTPITQLAYCFATAYLETAFTMQPIREIGNTAYFTKLYDVQGRNPARARKMGNVRPGDGAKYRGRGLVQLTWRVNYEKATVELRKMGVLRVLESLVDNPELACRPDIAVLLMFEGMERGWFTGVSLDDTIDELVNGDEFADYVRARRIINGADKAEKIAAYAKGFLAALQASYRPDQASPLSTQAKPLLAASEAPKPVSGGLFARLHAALSRKG